MRESRSLADSDLVGKIPILRKGPQVFHGCLATLGSVSLSQTPLCVRAAGGLFASDQGVAAAPPDASRPKAPEPGRVVAVFLGVLPNPAARPLSGGDGGEGSAFCYCVAPACPESFEGHPCWLFCSSPGLLSRSLLPFDASATQRRRRATTPVAGTKPSPGSSACPTTATAPSK